MFPAGLDSRARPLFCFYRDARAELLPIGIVITVFLVRILCLPDLGCSSSVVSTFMQEVYMCLAFIDRQLLPPHENVPRS